jgi:hypothetical protein
MWPLAKGRFSGLVVVGITSGGRADEHSWQSVWLATCCRTVWVTTHSHPHLTCMHRIPIPPRPASHKNPLGPTPLIPIAAPAPNNPFPPAPPAGQDDI